MLSLRVCLKLDCMFFDCILGCTVRFLGHPRSCMYCFLGVLKNLFLAEHIQTAQKIALYSTIRDLSLIM